MDTCNSQPQILPNLSRLNADQLLCARNTWHTKSKTCYVAAAFVLASKIKYIQTNLKDHTRDYFNFLLFQPTKIDSHICKKIPEEIRMEYTKAYKHPIKSGGSSFDLFQSILIANDINHCWYQIYNVDFNKFPILTTENIHTHNSLYFIDIHNSNDSLLIYEFEIDKEGDFFNVKHLRSKIDGVVSPMVKGGLIKLKSKTRKRADGQPKGHSVAFTVCNDKMLLCNFGKCNIYGDNNTHDYTISAIALLLLKTD